MSNRPLAAIILAAGQGTRMKSEKHKVLHPIAGKPMLHHLLDSFAAANIDRSVVVVGVKREQVEAAVADYPVDIAVQSEQLGTGHAVLQAQPALEGFDGDIMACFGDVPMVQPETISAMVARLHEDDKPACVVLGFRPDDTKAYGRIISENGLISKMVEHKDASEAERGVNLCNSGLLLARSEDMFGLLARVDNDNAQGEYYLPDMVTVALAENRACAVIECAEWEVAGVNSRAELAAVEGEWQQRRRAQAMADGVSLIAPETVWFSSDTQVSSDVIIEPNVIFGPGVSIASGATIYGHSHIEGATIGANAKVGPFARLRPGAVMEEGSKVGNFVEMKKATLGKGAKANHLTYLGDAEVGEGANIGAGTITCNYDGYFKYKTVIGKGAFIGSNSALVAPVNIGDGAIVGAGATLTKDVAAGDLALVRAEQTAKEGWADRFNKASAKKKAGK
ncbi:bifunctional UDP-N-acetylglucosamine diphosphorylase/glucosamine-1-phosphate N-acetyltransferase GlmU [Parasphingorhabdus halotolerans]|uniref:Bifunctional protein GlmU n=1 Tax=Parasphingorhabdus halotolerans TaxID=2725558 RepID=A0A6H2DJH5_9SPHN|nr:bifunctional UDP-N-acetylglucosamine diphosphorylase/glucosamine-1-phosphate N-acetyltransferase GlmU [Parasphingorhabdus halotolerans]QJB68484.1 bifunctional UDP-N-acetylglucosamine diphosphorylase/glucosamine-1-phosphate N-acetyltransferase GlmU [Parasphingorhabdus halotolerans]